MRLIHDIMKRGFKQKKFSLSWTASQELLLVVDCHICSSIKGAKKSLAKSLTAFFQLVKLLKKKT